MFRGCPPEGSSGRRDFSSAVASRSTAVVSQTCRSSTTGDDQPRPGSGVFQATFSVSLQVSGRWRAAGACPWPSGPRHCGQGMSSAAWIVAELTPQSRQATSMRRRRDDRWDFRNIPLEYPRRRGVGRAEEPDRRRQPSSSLRPAPPGGRGVWPGGRPQKAEVFRLAGCLGRFAAACYSPRFPEGLACAQVHSMSSGSSC